MLSAEKMHSLYDFFTDIPDPRRAQGRRHSLPTVLAISPAAAVLCGMEGYKAIWDWAKPVLSQLKGCLAPKGGSVFVVVT
jgi:DDE_Tnp_1-associated